ncbi:MAG: formyltransferase family protein [Calothrix sp. MO_167.B12]|nr:formyltransferase family protein [Calothrix sp. MO_167.B12]
MRQLKIALLSQSSSPILGYIIENLLENQIQIHSVIMDSKTLSDKDQQIWNERTQNKLPTIPLHKFEQQQIPCYFFSHHSSQETTQFVEEQGIDLLINAGTPRILKENILKAPKIGVVNCHPGILPNFRGCSCVEWAIYLDEEIGNTVHLMTKEIDEGPLIIQEGLKFDKSDKYYDVRVKVYSSGFKLLARGIKLMIESEHDFWKDIYDKDGRYFKPIDKDKMDIVLNKINSGNYEYQN